MNGWNEHTGVAVSLPMDNIDTDQLIPARFMSRSRSDGYGDYLMHDLRQSVEQQGAAGFILDRFPDASVLITGRNFGSGSSREAAVYALRDAGFKAVISTGFGDIFRANASNNGLLTAVVDASDSRCLLDYLHNESATVLINIRQRSITLEDTVIAFQLDEMPALKLINGWDDVDLTQAYNEQIAEFRLQQLADRQWIWPDEASG